MYPMDMKARSIAFSLMALLIITGCTHTEDTPTGGEYEPVTIPTIESAKHEPTSEPVPDITAIPVKSIALTFDDGPSEYTDRILDILEKEDVPATFFVIGSQVTPDQYPTLKRMSGDGMRIALHTWSHADLSHSSDTTVVDELDKTSDAIEQVTGEPSTCYRPPYGATSQHVRSLAENHGYTNEQLWGIDSEDWQRPGADKIFKNATQPADTPDVPSVILMHDGGGNREQTLEALPRIIHYYKDHGYTFTVSCL